MESKRAPQIPSGTLIEGRYRVLTRMGTGGFGEIYRVHDEVLGRELVLKIPRVDLARSEAFRRAFIREARLAMELRSPGTVAVRDAGQVGSLPYFTMDLVPGMDLRKLLNQEGRLTAERAIRISVELLGVLEEAHERGIVHRDLKPANLMIVPPRSEGEDEGVVLLDFGIARVLSSAPGSSTLGLGRIVGSPQYMSPEQAAGDHVDAGADLYAVGVLLFEMLAGAPPFEAAETGRLLMKQITQEAPALRDVAPDLQAMPRLEQVIRRALEKERRDRFATASQFRAELLACSAEGLTAPQEPGLISEPTVSLPQKVAGSVARNVEARNSEDELLFDEPFEGREPWAQVAQEFEAQEDDDEVPEVLHGSLREDETQSFGESSALWRRRAARRRRRRRRTLLQLVLGVAVLAASGTALYPLLEQDLRRATPGDASVPGSPGKAEFVFLGTTEIFTSQDVATVRGRMLEPVPGALVRAGQAQSLVQPDGLFEIAVPTSPSRDLDVECSLPGGASYRASVRLVHDLEPPVIHVLRPARTELAWRGDQYEVEVRVLDESVERVELFPRDRNTERVPMSPAGDGSGRYLCTVKLAEDGPHAFVVEAIDRAEWKSDPAEVRLVRDRSGPRLTIEEPRQGGLVCGSTVTVRFHAIDDEVVYAAVNGYEASEVANGLYEARLPATEEQAKQGRIDLLLSAEDGLGNIAQRTSYVFLDRKGPVLQRLEPPDGSAVEPGQQAITLTFDEPIVSGTLDGKAFDTESSETVTVQVFVRAPKTRFAAKVLDRCGNVTEVPFEYEVKLAPPPRMKESVGDGAKQVWVEPGKFLMGEPEPLEPGRSPIARTPAIPVKLTRGFYIDVHEVSVARYRKFLRQWQLERGSGRLPYEHPEQPASWDHEPPDWSQQVRYADRPVTNVAWWDAYAYARWAGKRLPTEIEWEFAARGPSMRRGRRWPLGNSMDGLRAANYAGSFYRRATDVGYFAGDQAACGAADMTGNVREWCSTPFEPERYSDLLQRKPTGLIDEPDPLVTKDYHFTYFTVRGGSFADQASECEASKRRGSPPDYRNQNLGFRCVEPRRSPR